MTVFAPEKINAAVSDALRAADLGASKKNAVVVVVTSDHDGNILVKAALSQKVGDYWQVKALVTIDSEKHISGGIEIKAAW